MKSRLLLLFLLVTAVCRGQNLIPQPNLIQKQEGKYLVTPHTEIYSSDFPELVNYLNDHLERVCGYRLPVGKHLRTMQQISLVRHDIGLSDEGYLLHISPTRISIQGNDRAGIFYALQTLFQLMPPAVYGSASVAGTLEIPCYSIEDEPRFPYRGVMLDVSRTFFDKRTVMQYIDWMARHKINTLHWHLSDDNGWRIEIKKYPELTSKGGWRGPSEVLPPSYGSGNVRYGGFYTQEEVREIVQYAADRHVDIIPEIDLPGHSQTLTSVYPETFCSLNSTADYPVEESRNVLCVAREENFEMLHAIFKELAALFPSKYIHIGCDEVSQKYWKECTRCQALMKEKRMKSTADLKFYFVRRMEEMIHGLGKSCGAWNEALSSDLRAGTLIYGWEDVEACKRAANAGQPLVMLPASYCYIDMKQHAWDRGHTWAGLVDTYRVYDLEPTDYLSAENLQWVKGIEAAQWAELMDRPVGFLEYQGYPRICALAEVGWTRPEYRNWDDFYQRLTHSHLERLGAMGIRFRMFPPVVHYRSGVITVGADSLWGEVRYTDDLSEPTRSSPLYTQPIRTTHPERYLFRAFRYGGASTVITPTVQCARTSLAPGQQQTLCVPLEECIDRDGIWLLSFTQLQDNAMINRLEVKGADTTYVIIQNGQKVSPFNDLRIYVDSLNRNANLSVTLQNNSTKRDELQLYLRPSLYIEPSVTVTSSIPCMGKFPITNTSNYRFSSCVRSQRPCKAGDYILFTFDEAVKCAAVDVRTGLPDITRFIVTDGSVSYSSDGKTFEGEVPLDETGTVMIRPDKAVKAVRISIRGSNGETILSWQNLRIIPL